MKIMKQLVLSLLVGISLNSVGQDEEAVVSANTSCMTAQKICAIGFYSELVDYNICESEASLFFSFQIGEGGAISSNHFELLSGQGNYIIYGPLNGEGCDAILNYSAPMIAGTMSTSNLLPVMEGNYILQIIPNSCSGTIRFIGKDGNLMCSNELNECENCVTSFQPKPGKYIVSAWVKEEGASPNITSYENASIKVHFNDVSLTYILEPKGQIIDGWQRIEEAIIVPSSATSINIDLQTENGDAYFDDIRFYPNDGSMMSYVYDPISLRLMAELDERNYATLYEYDEEGKLIRIKKETEKGIMTIQENRDNIKKN